MKDDKWAASLVKRACDAIAEQWLGNRRYRLVASRLGEDGIWYGAVELALHAGIDADGESLIRKAHGGPVQAMIIDPERALVADRPALCREVYLESMGPVHVDCPPEVLSRLGKPVGATAAKWRLAAMARSVQTA